MANGIYIAKTYEIELVQSRTAPNYDLSKIKDRLRRDFYEYIGCVSYDENDYSINFEICQDGIWEMIDYYKNREDELSDTITELLREIVIVSQPSKSGYYAVFSV